MHHGMLTIYKEAGYTSSDAVARLRGILRMRKIGHTGTLDPDAEGVLPMCLGNATKICELIADKEKEYVAVMRLGVRTDTQDMSGNVLFKMEDEEILSRLCGSGAAAKERGALSGNEAASMQRTGAEQNLSEQVLPENVLPEQALPEQTLSKQVMPEQILPENVLPEQILSEPERAAGFAERRIRAEAARFVGEIGQIPPMYSAIKVNGKRLYDLARKGKTVERKPRRVTIYALEIEKIELPLVTMRIRCSRGTYIRTLCEDLGNALGTGAAMESLLRTLVGQFTLEEARTLDEIERIAKTEPPQVLEALIRPVDSFFADLPAAACREDAVRLLRNGNALENSELRFLPPEEDPQYARKNSAAPAPDDGVIRVYDNKGVFYGLYKKGQGQRRYTALKMFLPEKQGG